MLKALFRYYCNSGPAQIPSSLGARLIHHHALADILTFANLTNLRPLESPQNTDHVGQTRHKNCKPGRVKNARKCGRKSQANRESHTLSIEKKPRFSDTPTLRMILNIAYASAHQGNNFPTFNAMKFSCTPSPAITPGAYLMIGANDQCQAEQERSVLLREGPTGSSLIWILSAPHLALF